MKALQRYAYYHYVKKKGGVIFWKKPMRNSIRIVLVVSSMTCTIFGMQIPGFDTGIFFNESFIVMSVAQNKEKSIYIDIIIKVTGKDFLYSFYHVGKDRRRARFDLQLANASSFASNRQYIMIGTDTGHVRVIDREEFLELESKEQKFLERTHDVKLHNTAIYKIYADEEYLVTGSDARTICMWKIADFELYRQNPQKNQCPFTNGAMHIF